MVTCPDCGHDYFAGVVGTTPVPAHICPVAQERAEGQRLRKAAEGMVAALEATYYEWDKHTDAALAALREALAA